MENQNKSLIFPFSRDFMGGKHTFTLIGDGEMGGKARGLAEVKRVVESFFQDHSLGPLIVNIPRLTVITTRYFDQFIKENQLSDFIHSQPASISDERIAHHFQSATLSSELSGDLWALASQMHTPLAIRSSSLMEDKLKAPFAGVYETKMIPNNQPSSKDRFQKLVEAIKFVYASTYFAGAKNYMMATGNNIEDEKMAVIVQEVIGEKHYERFYPHIAGVARSLNYYPIGHATPQEGIVSLVLGLGKTIVDEGISWNYCPAYPLAPPPFNNIGDLLDTTQREFWAVNMGKLPQYDPVKETEYLIKSGLEKAEYDNTLKYVASTYDAQSDRINMGIGSPGPRIINFASILELNTIPLNQLLKDLLKLLEDHLQEKVEIEFALTLGGKNENPSRFGLLQVRPIAQSREEVIITENDLHEKKYLLFSRNTLGNGSKNSLMDIVYVKPESFAIQKSPQIALEIESCNRRLLKQKTSYLLIGFGRWGTSDPWLGIPVKWPQISGAEAIVESTLDNLTVDLSQGTHFFHNVTNLGVFYFTLKHNDPHPLDWSWLQKQMTIEETPFVRHVKLKSPLHIKVDGRQKTGVILK